MWGKGIQSPGKGKGAFQGAAKGYQPGDKSAQKGAFGKPRGFQGRCNACGGWGHRAAECPSSFRAYSVEQQWETTEDEAAAVQDEPVSLGSVWMIGHLKSEKGVA